MELVLHHYPASPFSEKVRAMLGFLAAEWHSVEIPNIMPRPLLLPLAGGYRKTPTLQIGANVYCDTAVIAHALARQTGSAALFAPGFVAHRLAEWADTQLFRVAVALIFRPEAMGSLMSQLGGTDPGEFMKDRAQLTEGSTLSASSPAAAEAALRHYLTQLDRSLEVEFLFGAAPSIADFSLYQALWFVDASPANGPLIDPFPHVRGWMQRMAGFGHGSPREISGEVALELAAKVEPVLPPIENALPDGFAVGDAVTVTPVDYGKIPVAGAIAAWSADEVVLDRHDRQVGHVMTHFPSAGFEVAKA